MLLSDNLPDLLFLTCAKIFYFNLISFLFLTVFLFLIISIMLITIYINVFKKTVIKITPIIAIYTCFIYNDNTSILILIWMIYILIIEALHRMSMHLTDTQFTVSWIFAYLLILLCRKFTLFTYLDNAYFTLCFI